MVDENSDDFFTERKRLLSRRATALAGFIVLDTCDNASQNLLSISDVS